MRKLHRHRIVYSIIRCIVERVNVASSIYRYFCFRLHYPIVYRAEIGCKILPHVSSAHTCEYLIVVLFSLVVVVAQAYLIERVRLRATLHRQFVYLLRIGYCCRGCGMKVAVFYSELVGLARLAAEVRRGIYIRWRIALRIAPGKHNALLAVAHRNLRPPHDAARQTVKRLILIAYVYILREDNNRKTVILYPSFHNKFVVLLRQVVA